ncbi:MAG: hypothetical protein AB1801_29270, partial [Chloroflexota bacterium]
MMRNSVLKPNQEMQTELHSSPQLIIPLLIILAFITIFSTHFALDPDERLKIRLFALLFYALAGGIWLLNKWRDRL